MRRTLAFTAALATAGAVAISASADTPPTARVAAKAITKRGARARGVKVGDRIKDIKDAFPGAKVNKKTEEIFGIWLVRVPKSAGGLIRFSVPVDTKRIDAIGVPAIPFCE
jgi:hypothetical protein